MNVTTGLKNIVRNFWFLVSAVAFFMLCVTYMSGYFWGVLIATAILIIIAAQVESIWGLVKHNPILLHVISALATMGICLETKKYNYEMCKYVFRIQEKLPQVPASIDIAAYISTVGMVLGAYFVYVCVSLFWKEFIRIINETTLFKNIKKWEMFVYIMFLLVAILCVTFCFSKTDAFYGTTYSYDVIYTSDSPYLVKGNVYVILTQAENDLRQPLFAVFAAPFVGLAYVWKHLFELSVPVQAMLINYVQVVLLLVANFMLTKIMKLDAVKRVCFMALTSCTYMQLLFLNMMEQYMVAYFWLIFCIYLISEGQIKNRMVLWGAGGTLLTSLVLLLFMSDASPFKNFKKWFIDMVKYGVEFVLFLLVCCRFDIIYNLGTKISFLGGFTGREITTADKVYQYTEFVHNCFFAPKAGVDFTTFDHVSWQLAIPTGINFIGVFIFIIAIVSAVLNRDRKSSLLATMWLVFSIVLLFGLGWGMAENGLILYSLYFGWSFLVLIFQLVEKIEMKLKVKYIIPVISACGVLVLLGSNIPAFLELLHFATTYFPI